MKNISLIDCIAVKNVSLIYYITMKTISLIHSNCCKKYITAIAVLVGSGLYSIAVKKYVNSTSTPETKSKFDPCWNCKIAPRNWSISPIDRLLLPLQPSLPCSCHYLWSMVRNTKARRWLGSFPSSPSKYESCKFPYRRNQHGCPHPIRWRDPDPRSNPDTCSSPDKQPRWRRTPATLVADDTWMSPSLRHWRRPVQAR